MEKAREFQKNIDFCFIDYAKVFDCVDHNKLWKILQEMRIPDHLTCLLRNLYAGQEATELDMEQETGSKSGKEYVKAVYCHPAYLTSKQSTSWETLGWRKHKLESRLLGEISITSDMAECEEELKSLLMRVKEESEKVGSTFRKQKSWHLVPSVHGKYMEKQWKQCPTLFLGAPKSLQMVIAAMKLKDTYSLEGKLWST